MKKHYIHSVLGVSLLFSSVRDVQAQACNTGTNTGEPTWSTVLDSSTTGTYAHYIGNNTSPETTGSTATIANHSSLITPGNNGFGGYNEDRGSIYGPWTYGGGPYWAVNNSHWPTPSTSCTPNGSTTGTGCNVCVSSSSVTDCYGYTIPRTPADFLRTALQNTSSGFHFTGSFKGDATIPSGSSLIEAVYFHEAVQYVGYSEYGFFRNANSDSQLWFYWDTQSNCTYLCSDTEGGSQNLSTHQGQCYISIDPRDSLDVKVWVYPDNNSYYWFAVKIHDSTTNTDYEYKIDSNSSGYGWDSTNWGSFPLNYLVHGGLGNQGQGYVTLGVSRTDPGNNQTYTTNPYLSVSALQIGN